MSQLPADWLNDIFEFLEDDTFTLHSCILVNRLWCEVSIRIAWRNVCNYSTSNFSTLISCLPNESKEILNKNGIIILTPTSKFPTFNYASFCKVLSIREIYYYLELLLRNQKSISSQNLNVNINIIAEEILKLFVNQIPSLKQLEISTFSQFTTLQTPTTYFIYCPEAKDCLKNLSELHCCTHILSESFYQLSQICHNLLLLDIIVEKHISDGLVDLISAQKILKYLGIMRDYPQINDIDNLNLSMKKLPNTVISLILLGGIPCNTSLSFITNFKDLQELKIEYLHAEGFIGFEDLQHIIFPKLQILNFVYAFPKSELLMKFLENNGNSLKEIYLFEKYINNIDNSINLAIAKFCPVLRKLSTAIKNNKLETLKIILDSCQYLESIKVCCGSLFLYEKEVLDTIMEYSKNIHEIILDYYEYLKVEILPEELESFFLNWKNLIPQRSLSLVVDNFSGLYEDVKKREIIKKYIKLGVIKEFKVKGSQ